MNEHAPRKHRRVKPLMDRLESRCLLSVAPPPAPPPDYNGDGRTDFAVFDPTNATFYVVESGGTRKAVPLGNPSDPLIPLVGDYFGDGKDDFAVFDPTNATFYVVGDAGQRMAVPLGNPADPLIPLVGDYFGDGKDDFAIFDPTNATFYAVGVSGQRNGLPLGNSADPLIPLTGDYFGDGTDFAVFDPTIATFYVVGDAGQRKAVPLGNPVDSVIPLVGDYFGDGKDDFAIFDPTNANFYVVGVSGQRTGAALGNPADPLIPLVGDYDGDLKADYSIFDPTHATFYVIKSGGGRTGVALGNPANPLIPLVTPNHSPTGSPRLSPQFTGTSVLPKAFPDFSGDAKTDVTLYDPTSSQFSFAVTGTQTGVPLYTGSFPLGIASHHPVPLLGDFNGDGRTDVAIYDPTTSTFYFTVTSNPIYGGFYQLGNPSDHPIPLIGDFNGDGKSDVAIYDPVTSTFLIAITGSTNTPGVSFYVQAFQLGNPSAHPIPLIGDFNGDGLSDVAIYDPTTSVFLFAVVQPFSDLPLYTSAYRFGNPANHPIPLVGDFNADGKTDFALYDPTTSTFFFENTVGPNMFPLAENAYQFGNPSHQLIPLLGDFNADGKTDFALYDPTTSIFNFEVTGNTANFPLYSGTYQLGNPSDHDVPLLGDFNADGKADVAVYDPTDSQFNFDVTGTVIGVPAYTGFYQLGNPTNHPIPLLKTGRRTPQLET